jgi:cGMP-dependent protein kinase
VVSPTCSLWSLGKSDFRDAIAAYEQKQLTEKIQFVKQIKLFEKLVNSSLEMIADAMVLKSYKAGEKIIRQGDIGDAFYMIVRGRVVVTQTKPSSLSGLFSLSASSSARGSDADAGLVLVRLGPGEYFGELALLENSPRKATVTASVAVQCYTLDRSSFMSLFGSMEEAINESIGVTMLRKVKILETLSDKQLLLLSRRLTTSLYSSGDVIIKQGDIGDAFYMLTEGNVSVQVNHVQLAILGPGAFFGEMSLMSNERRSATVVAMASPPAPAQSSAEAGDDEDSGCSERLSNRKKNEIAATSGTVETEDVDRSAVRCFVLSRADFVELLGPLDALIKAESKRRAEMLANANSPSSPLLSRLRSLSSSMFGGGGTNASSPVGAAGSSKNSSSRARKSTSAEFISTSALFDIDALEKVKRIGSGTFSEVFLVRDALSDKQYAMKVLLKNNLLITKQERSIFSERDSCLLAANCQFVVPLFATLQDEHSVYFIEQFVPTGDLWNALYNATSPSKCMLPISKVGGLLLPAAQFYASVILAFLVHIHEQELIFRDLKPENMVGMLIIIHNCLCRPNFINCLCYIIEMVDGNGYLKIVDFGSAKVLSLSDKLCRTYTLCGCAEYASPEAVLGKGYNRSVDFWAFGIFIYELLTRKTPFANDNMVLSLCFCI